jgi:hypothetical protein
MVSATIATVIRAEIGKEQLPTLSTKSNTLPGVTRQWTSLDDLVKEVSLGRMYCGVHYRNSTEVGNKMGEEVGNVVAAAYGMR